MRTKEQYIERLSKMKRNLFLSGEKIGRDNEQFIPSFNVMGKTFDLAQKYTTRSANMSPENQAQLWRHIGDLACSAKGGIACFGALHGGGSPRMETIAITSQYDIESRKEIVRKVAGMTKD